MINNIAKNNNSVCYSLQAIAEKIEKENYKKYTTKEVIYLNYLNFLKKEKWTIKNIVILYFYNIGGGKINYYSTKTQKKRAVNDQNNDSFYLNGKAYRIGRLKKNKRTREFIEDLI